MSDTTSRQPRFAPENCATFVELLRWRAVNHPDRTAIIFLQDGGAERARLTYAELDAEARRIGAFLQEQAKPGDTALLLYPAGIDFITAFFGCLYAGVIAIPLYPPHPRRPATRLQAVANDARPPFVLGTADLIGELRGRGLPGALESAQWLATSSAETTSASAWRDPHVGPGSLAFLQYTSGSTATPKGVKVSHANILHNERMIQAAAGHPDGFTMVGWLPLYHDMGLIGNLLQPLFLGGKAVMMAPTAFLQRPHVWLQAISTYRAYTSGGPNFAYELCVRRITAPQKATLDLGSWRMAFNGAEPISPATLDRFSAAFAECGFRPESFFPCYGLAEATLLVAAHRPGSPPTIRRFRRKGLQTGKAVKAAARERDVRTLVACGRPWLDEQLVIVDPESREICRPGRIGEIWAAGPHIAHGYWNAPEASASTFEARLADGRGPFLRTGDLGFMHGDELFIAGRLKDLIIIDGRNHHPQDIERTVEASSDALQAGASAAFSVERCGAERLVVTAEVDRHFRRDAADEVFGAIRQAIAWEHEVEVDAVVLVKTGTIFKTSSGKIQRYACRAAFLADELTVVARWSSPAGDAVPSLPQSSIGSNSPHLPDLPHSSYAPASATAMAIGGVGPETSGGPGRDAVRDEIVRWLASRIATRLGVSPDAVDVRQPFSSFGLGSVDAVTLTGDLCAWLERDLAPTLLYEYSTIDSLATHLSGRPADAAIHEAPPAADGPAAPRASSDVSSDASLAIVGIGCRFPGAHGPQAFWELLRDGVDAIGEVPQDRWDAGLYYSTAAGVAGKMNTRWGGFLEHVDRFDASFFGISPREAAHMDPQQRLLLEATWEALEDAGLPASELAGSRTGVFVGIGGSEYASLQIQRVTGVDAYSATGGALSIAANRISYFFDFHGPSLSVDTACSSSLVAIHLAAQSLRNRQSTLAVAGGVNVTLTPAITMSFAQGSATSPDGRCKAFDAAANGMVRSEGVGIVVLKLLSQAVADGDRIYAVIRGSAINQDGRSNGLTAPNPAAQQAVLADAYRDAGVRPADVQYVEAHGTGTLLGDPIEAKALGAVLGEGREPGRPCALGSAKTNIGHAESAAGVAGVIKVALSIHHGLLPPTLHFREPNPHIPFAALSLRVQDTLGPWPQADRPRLAGVSAFGFGGANAHVVLSEAPAVASSRTSDETGPADQGWLLPISAESEGALATFAERYREALLAPGGPALADVCFSASRHRNHHQRRMAVVGRSSEEIAEKLAAFAAGETRPGLTSGRAPANGRPRIAWVFSGYGAQWWAMGRQLLEEEPVFRDTVRECDRLFREHAGISLLDELQAEQSASRLDSDHLEIIQPALFAVQVGLAALWQSRGIVPDAVVGHSMGETAAACVAGVLSLEDAVRVTAHRARLMYDSLRRWPGRGAMAAVEISVEEAREAVRWMPELSLAAHNGPRTVVLSGEAAALDQVVESFGQRGIFCRRLHAPGAGHSPVVEEARRELVAALSWLRPQPARIPIVSTVTGELAEPGLFDAAYWGRNMRDSVLFAEAMDRLIEDKVDVFLEIAPHPILSTAIAECLRHRERTARVLPSLRRNEPERATILASLGALYASGCVVDWAGLYPEGRRIALPSYPWQRERFWLEPQEEDAGAPRKHPFLGRPLASAQPSGERFWQRTIRLKDFPFLRDHKVAGVPLVPGTAYIEMALAAATEFFGVTPGVLRRIQFQKALFMHDEDSRSLQIVLSPATNAQASIRICSRATDGGWTLHATADAYRDGPTDPPAGDIAAILSRCPEPIASADYYERFRQNGLDYGPTFRGVTEIWRGAGESIGQIEVPDALKGETGSYRCHPAWLDACLQTLGATKSIERHDHGEGIAGLPVSIDEIHFAPRAPSAVWSHARHVPSAADDTRTFTGDVRVFDDSGAVVADVRGFHVRLLDEQSAGLSEHWEDWVYELQWPAIQGAADAASAATPRESWLVLADRTGIGDRLAESLRAKGSSVFVAAAGEEYSTPDARSFTLRPGCFEDVQRSIAAVASVTSGPLGVVHLWSVDASPFQTSSFSWDAGQALGCGSAVQTVQALLPLLRTGRSPRLWLITSGSQVVADQDVSAIQQAPLWGLGRTVAQEHHAIWGGLVDLDPNASRDDNAAWLLSEICGADGEDQIAWRSSRRHAARLSPRRMPAVAGRPFLWRTDAAYLITGGTGGLGLAVARWMVDQGARRLILMNRTPLPPRHEWLALPADAPQYAAVAAVRALEAAGATVHLACADVADADQLASFFARFKAEGWPSIRGVVHAAGVARLDALEEMRPDQLFDVFQAKARGAWLLHQFFSREEISLDFFVLFSSFSTLLGSPGLAHYAAANSFLDALAHYRRSTGLPALAVNWGAWGGVGMAARFLQSGRTPLPGVQSFAPEQALAALDEFLRHEEIAQVGLTRVDWTQWRQLYPTYMNAPFLTLVGQGVSRSASSGRRSAGEEIVRATVLSVEPAERAAFLEEYLRKQVARVLGASPSKVDIDRPFNTLGIDSLTAVELKNQIEADLAVSIPVVGFLQARSVRDLAFELTAQLASAPAPDWIIPQDDLAQDDSAALSMIDGLSDAQVDTMINELQAAEEHR